ncbi:MAG: threonylcarbamoyl-AMP synthase [Mycobacteriaceae bacterium]|nr:threonylcarbamoyl-AMP synthase [Mycobacteriaceae bacterium]
MRAAAVRHRPAQRTGMTQFFDCRDPEGRAEAVAEAAAAVRSGRLVVMPTDTVYGIGADAFDSQAVAGLLAAKGRGRDMPVGVLVGSWQTIEGLVYAVPDSARELIRAFWPGALSLVVRQAPSLQWDLGDARGTVMLRMPLHPVAIELLRQRRRRVADRLSIAGARSRVQYRLTISEIANNYLALSDRGAGVPLRELVLVGLTAAIVTYFATGGVRQLATRLGAVAYPRERDVHLNPTPRMGGLAMYLGVVTAVFLASQLPALTRGFVYSSGMPAVVIAGGLVMGIGLIDDRWGLDALTKFAGQVTAASVLVTMGVAWSVLYIPFGGVGTIVLDQASSILLTLALTVAIINAMNFVDGLDGLAAGLGLIAAAAICLFSVGLLRDHGGDVLFYPPAVISVVLAGACLGFLPHNFHPARIFMGDSGSMLIGLMLAAASTTAAGPISQSAYGTRDVYALLSPFLLVVAVVFVPALDMLLAIVRRTRAGRSPFSPDKMHLHHRLLEIGHSHRRVVMVIYLWVGIVAMGAASTIFIGPRYSGAVMLVAIVIALVVTVIPLLRTRDDGYRTTIGK